VTKARPATFGATERKATNGVGELKLKRKIIHFVLSFKIVHETFISHCSLVVAPSWYKKPNLFYYFPCVCIKKNLSI